MTTNTSGSRINAAWKAAERTMVKALGWPAFDVFVEPMIPLRYEGATLVLGAPSGFARDYFQRQLLKRLERIVGAPLVVEISDVAKKAAARRPDVSARRAAWKEREKAWEAKSDADR